MTLSDVVDAVREVTEDEREVVEVVLHMLRSGSVKLSSARAVIVVKHSKRALH
jgi:hypothetical protein